MKLSKMVAAIIEALTHSDHVEEGAIWLAIPAIFRQVLPLAMLAQRTLSPFILMRCTHHKIAARCRDPSQIANPTFVSRRGLC